MSNAVWYGGLAVVLAASVAFGSRGGWIAAIVVLVSKAYLFRYIKRAYDAEMT